MRSRRNIFIGAIILVFLGAALVYYLPFREEQKPDVVPSKTNRSGSDSVTQSNPEATPVEMGVKPAKNPKDGSVKIVEEFIKSSAKNPATFEFLEWSEVSSEDGYWKVRCKYSGVSSFDAEVTTNAWFYIRNNKVVRTKVISKI